MHFLYIFRRVKIKIQNYCPTKLTKPPDFHRQLLIIYFNIKFFRLQIKILSNLKFENYD